MKLFTWIRQLLPAIRSEVAINLLEEGLDCHNPASRDIIQQDHLIGTTYNYDMDSKKQEGKIDRKCY